MFEFTTKDNHTVKHKPSGMLFQILINPEDKLDYDAWEDTYQEFEFKGNHIVCLMLNSEEFFPEPAPIGWQKIHAINRKAFKFFKSKVFIEAYEKPEGDFETERYLLQENESKDGWVCTDKGHQFVITWHNKQFSKTQKIVFLEDFSKGIMPIIPRLIIEIGEWLAENHSNKI